MRNRMVPAETMSKAEKNKNFKSLFKAMSPYYGKIALSAVFIVISTVLSILAPQWLSKLTNEIMDNAATQSINLKRIADLAIVLIVFYASNALFNYLSGFIMTTVTQKYKKDVRRQISYKINSITLNYTTDISTAILCPSSPMTWIRSARPCSKPRRCSFPRFSCWPACSSPCSSPAGKWRLRCFSLCRL